AATVDRVAVELAGGQDLPALVARGFGLSKGLVAHLLSVLLGGGLIAWALARAQGRSADVLLGGMGIGAVIVAMWWVSGRLGHVGEDPRTLQEAFVATNSQRMESLSFVAPVAYAIDWLLFFSDRSKVLTIGIVSTVGVVLGSALVALASRNFRWEGFAGAEDTANHLGGAVLMGVGGVTALGCTVGQGLSGVSTLAIGSFIALGGIIAGAVLALKYQVWRLGRMA
ncbi:MAG: YeeE/YedE family protein, partial [Aquincola sp.]|nr:YeeE/YedE family protein [Aquincola sp.]